MNAPTAQPSATIPKTNVTATAAGATSTTDLRIDDYIRSRLKEAHSVDYSGLRSTAEAARRHGFTSCANSRYADFLAAFQGAPDLVTHYAESYPACCFLPWAALRSTMASLSLWCDLPEHYTGAIPSEQLPWLDLFALDSADWVQGVELVELVKTSDDEDTSMMQWLLQRQRPHERFLDVSMRVSPERVARVSASMEAHVTAKLGPMVKAFRESWFVIAPSDAFRSQVDFRERVRRLMSEVSFEIRVPPNDPLVVRFVRGGALVVAAWGDEAAELNAQVAALKI